MFEKIIFPFDFSKFSEMAVSYVEKLMEFGAKEVVLVNVLEYEEFTTRPLSKIELEEYKKGSYDRLNGIKEILEKSGLKVYIRVEFGIPSKVITAVAEEEKANLIVVSSTGAGYTPSLIGSTVQNIIRLSKIPVLVIPSF